MSALGQKQTFKRLRLTSALLPKADIAERDWHVRFVPKADIPRRSEIALFDHLAGGHKKTLRHSVRLSPRAEVRWECCRPIVA